MFTDIALVCLLFICGCLLYIVHVQHKINAQQALMNKLYSEHLDSIWRALSEHLREHLLSIIKEEDAEHV